MAVIPENGMERALYDFTFICCLCRRLNEFWPLDRRTTQIFLEYKFVRRASCAVISVYFSAESKLKQNKKEKSGGKSKKRKWER